MIYISTSCLKHKNVKDSIEELADNGFRNIELSGGSVYWEKCGEDLFKLKSKYALNYMLHNYFPPPENNFVLNMASLDDEIYKKTVAHYKKSIVLSRDLGATKFGLHAGYFVDLELSELGASVKFRQQYDHREALMKFSEGFNMLKEVAGRSVELYVENNVLSKTNSDIFKGSTPFMLLDYKGYEELSDLIDFKLLLDVGHLNTSANLLGIDFAEEIDRMIRISDYIHLSDNDGSSDRHRALKTNSPISDTLKKYDLSGKIITLETRSEITDLKKSVSMVQEIWG